MRLRIPVSVLRLPVALAMASVAVTAFSAVPETAPARHSVGVFPVAPPHQIDPCAFGACW